NIFGCAALDFSRESKESLPLRFLFLTTWNFLKRLV
ncbi:MAG: hypothetical protein ACJAWX_000410, partial [Algoriphagus sp.]